MVHACFIQAAHSQTSPIPSKPGFDLTAAQCGIAMELRLPCTSHPESAFPDWLDEVREMRARVLYDEGRRPHFRLPDGSFGDRDPVDLEAYHIIGRSQGHAVGYGRIVPLAVESGFISFTCSIAPQHPRSNAAD